MLRRTRSLISVLRRPSPQAKNTIRMIVLRICTRRIRRSNMAAHAKLIRQRMQPRLPQQSQSTPDGQHDERDKSHALHCNAGLRIHQHKSSLQLRLNSPDHQKFLPKIAKKWRTSPPLRTCFLPHCYLLSITSTFPLSATLAFSSSLSPSLPHYINSQPKQHPARPTAPQGRCHVARSTSTTLRNPTSPTPHNQLRLPTLPPKPRQTTWGRSWLSRPRRRSRRRIQCSLRQPANALPAPRSPRYPTLHERRPLPGRLLRS